SFIDSSIPDVNKLMNNTVNKIGKIIAQKIIPRSCKCLIPSVSMIAFIFNPYFLYFSIPIHEVDSPLSEEIHLLTLVALFLTALLYFHFSCYLRLFLSSLVAEMPSYIHIHPF